MDEAKARVLEETIQELKNENARLKEALEWAADEMLNGTNRWFETSRPGERYYDWFVRELRYRAGVS